ncbi:MAG: hypothetical protein ABJF10_12900 [Chthoniobacter sp.]|uniref:hypothetical protein n=1 Tax=Chthoniobacter sp. TaxID=2510640 RepID=UPI0032A17147
MPSFDTNTAIQTTLDQSKELAKTLFKQFADQATQDTKDFLNRSKDGVERAGLLFAQRKIEKDDFEDLLLGKKDLAAMHALKQTGLASAAIDTFTNGVLQILINAALAAVKL